jgi:formate dehydrogenase subunit delta
MNIEHMVTMANDIANFFNSEMVSPDEAAKAVALHISRYWDPRMRRHIIDHGRQGGEGLSPTAAAAVSQLAPVPDARAAG